MFNSRFAPDHRRKTRFDVRSSCGALSCWLEPRHRPIRVEHGQEPTVFKHLQKIGSARRKSLLFDGNLASRDSRINRESFNFHAPRGVAQQCQRQVGFQLLILDIVLNLSRSRRTAGTKQKPFEQAAD